MHTKAKQRIEEMKKTESVSDIPDLLSSLPDISIASIKASVMKMCDDLIISGIEPSDEEKIAKLRSYIDVNL